MSDAVLIGLFGLVASTLSVAGTVVIAWLQLKTRHDLGEVKGDVADVKHQTTSLTERLVEQAGAVGHGEGVAQERARHRADPDEAAERGGAG